MKSYHKVFIIFLVGIISGCKTLSKNSQIKTLKDQPSKLSISEEKELYIIDNPNNEDYVISFDSGENCIFEDFASQNKYKIEKNNFPKLKLKDISISKCSSIDSSYECKKITGSPEETGYHKTCGMHYQNSQALNLTDGKRIGLDFYKLLIDLQTKIKSCDNSQEISKKMTGPIEEIISLGPIKGPEYIALTFLKIGNISPPP